MTPTQTIAEKLLASAQNYFPSSALFEITRRCNLTCRYCYQRQENTNNTQNLSTDDCKTILDRLHAAGVLSLCITGGEPFIRHDLLPILDHIRSRDFFSTTFMSNGSLINKEHCTYLKRHASYFPAIKLSAFSHIPAIHDAFTGMAGSLNALIENGKRLQDSYIAVSISLNLIDTNLETYKETAEFFQALGFTLEYGLEKIINNDYVEKSWLEKMVTVEFLSRYIQLTHNDLCKGIVQNYRFFVNAKEGDLRPCIGLTQEVSIDADGNIRPCINFQKLLIGNILKDNRPLNEILKSHQEYRHIRAIKKTDIPACRSCKHLYFCYPCLGIMHTTTGGFSTPPITSCNYATALEQFAQSA